MEFWIKIKVIVMGLLFLPVLFLLVLQSAINCPSAAIAVTKQPASILPRFTWLDNYAIHVLFPNGVEDTIKLWPAEKVGDMTIPCLYEGVLEAESPSSVAVSGCQDDDMVQIVIYTNLLPGRTMFNIRSGIPEEVEKIDRDDKNNDVVEKSNRRRLRKRGTFLGDDYDDIASDGSDNFDPPPFLQLNVKLAFEESLLAKAGNEDVAREYIARVFTLGKQHMMHATLGTSIRLKAQGPIKKIPNKRWKPIRSDLLESIESKEPEDVPVTFFCYNDDRNNDTGISYTRRGCHKTKGVAIVAHREDLHQAAQTYIHECGHWFGFRHDADMDELEGTTCEGTGIMSNASTPGGRPSQWSKCSKLRLKRWLSKSENNCIKPDEKALQLEDICLAPAVTYDTVVKSKVNCHEVTVSAANYADCNGDYRVSEESVPWSPSRPVYAHVSLDRYIYWSARGHGWAIGKKEDLRSGNYYHYSGLDSSEPWEALWRNGITVECKGLSIRVGNYENHLYDDGGKNNWHYVTISRSKDGNYRWTYKVGVSWSLYETNKTDTLTVGKDCPYYDDGYTEAIFNATGVFGPGNEFYKYEVCELGWRQFGTNCYKEFPEPIKKQVAARDLCQAMGGDLVSLETEEEATFIENMLDQALRQGVLSSGTDIWLSARRSSTNSPFIWNTGKQITFSDWYPNQPSNTHNGPALCMQAFKNDHPIWQWHAANCDGGDHDNAILCEKTVTPVCELGWRQFGTNCYKEFPEPIRKQSVARDLCQAMGGDLVALETEEETIFLENMLDQVRQQGVLASGTDIWLSARRSSTNSPFIWNTGHQITFSDWYPSQPSNTHFGTALCMQTFKNNHLIWQWHVANCDGGDRDNAIVCEKMAK